MKKYFRPRKFINEMIYNFNELGFVKKIKKFFAGQNHLLPQKCYCNLCDKYFFSFLMIGEKGKLAKQHNLIGMGPRRGGCPMCGSSDKYRWLYYVLRNYTEIFIKQCSVLHFAPEKVISNKICENKQVYYVTGDKVDGLADSVIDMTDIHYSDNTFDYVIAGMVLEHIEDERRALSELKRVCKPQGKIILAIPFCEDMKSTLSNPEIKSQDDKMRYYGHRDHVRLYGRDYAQRIADFGLVEVVCHKPKDIWTDREIKRNGLQGDYSIIIATKRD